jgi:hypothetical protein
MIIDKKFSESKIFKGREQRKLLVGMNMADVMRKKRWHWRIMEMCWAGSIQNLEG